MPRKQHTHHYIYKTICLVTNRYYIGMHSTSNLDDGYIGSGTRLWKSINKHGKNNHKAEILEFLPDRESLKKREQELVNEDLLKDPMCMNITKGGDGGHLGLKRSDESIERLKQGNIGKNKGRKLPPRSEEHKRKLAEAKIGKKLSQEEKDHLSKVLTEKYASNEMRNIISEALKKSHEIRKSNRTSML